MDSVEVKGVFNANAFFQTLAAILSRKYGKQRAPRGDIWEEASVSHDVPLAPSRRKAPCPQLTLRCFLIYIAEEAGKRKKEVQP